MPKRFKKNVTSVPPLDLHGVHHANVCRIVEDYVLLNQYECPLTIITGNSEKMKKIVKDTLKSHGFNYLDGDMYNRGYIDVVN